MGENRFPVSPGWSLLWGIVCICLSSINGNISVQAGILHLLLGLSGER